MTGTLTTQEAEAATVRIGSALAIPGVLRSLGVDPAQVLAEVGIDIALFDDPEHRISFATRSRLLQHCVARTACRHFGLLVGAQNGLHSLGLLGLLMKYSPDVRSALQSLVRHLHLHGRGGLTTLDVQGERATLAYEIYLQRSVATDQIGDGSVAFMFNILRGLCGPDWRPEEALFAHRRPADAAEYRRLLQVPLRFDAEQYALVFSARNLERRLPASDPALHVLLQQQINALDTRRADDLPRQVRMVLRSALASRRANADHVAAIFSMHSRTLNRRLNACGTSFRTLLDEARFEMARQMLEDSSMDVRQIALALDYGEAGAFTRAFRRWTGVTPLQWRANPGQAARGAPGPGD
jgi:AraC-like DNA-binding protein